MLSYTIPSLRSPSDGRGQISPEFTVAAVACHSPCHMSQSPFSLHLSSSLSPLPFLLFQSFLNPTNGGTSEQKKKLTMTPTPLLLLFSHLLLAFPAVAFDFGSLALNDLKLLGDAHLKNGSIQLSRDLPVPNSGAGRALYAHPIEFRHPFSFSTFFSFSVVNLNPSSIGGGLAFVIASDDHSLGDAGGFLGLLNRSDSVDDGSKPIFLAVEFDTLMDEEFGDMNGNHVGVDLNTLVSTQAVDLSAAEIDIKSGDIVNSWVVYDDAAGKVLEVYVSYSTVRPSSPVISLPIDLAQFVNDYMFVGFSGSTQGSTEIHSVNWWNFTSSSASVSVSVPSPPATVANSSSAPTISPAGTTSSSCKDNGLCREGPGTGAVAGVATAGAFFLAVFAGFAVWVFAKRRPKPKPKPKPNNNDTLSVIEIVRSPREFTYRELTAATRSFDASRIIGRGAFGTVYKGIVQDTGAIIAVKRCISDNGGGGQGRAEFLSELSIIASLRHRNLVRLQGWCHEKEEILLVYDYMPNGSLDKALFEKRENPNPNSNSNSNPLPWRQRKRILSGVASALAYLHRECERQIIHRDVKSSNIMLDDDFHARLGDFGLARQVDHDKSPEATVTAGTMGYLAPEYLLTGKATDKTDVFSFGAVVLEVVCGRRPIESDTTTAVPTANLVEWVWGLHGQGRLEEAIDSRMETVEHDVGDVRRTMLVGLACSQPDPVARPSMRAVVQMLNGEAEPPVVPVAKPSMSFSTTQQLLMSLQDSVSDYNALTVTLCTSSSSSASVNGGGGAVRGEGR